MHNLIEATIDQFKTEQLILCLVNKNYLNCSYTDMCTSLSAYEHFFFLQWNDLW